MKHLKYTYRVYSIFPGGDYTFWYEGNSLSEAKDALRSERENRLDEIARGDSDYVWEVTTGLNRITKHELKRGSIEYGTLNALDNVGTPCHVVRESIMIAYDCA